MRPWDRESYKQSLRRSRYRLQLPGTPLLKRSRMLFPPSLPPLPPPSRSLLSVLLPPRSPSRPYLFLYLFSRLQFFFSIFIIDFLVSSPRSLTLFHLFFCCYIYTVFSVFILYLIYRRFNFLSLLFDSLFPYLPSLMTPV